jgi:hypothetical protein
MSKLHTGAALLLVALLGTVGCSVGTKTSGDASTATNQSPATSPTTPASPTSGTDTPASVPSGPPQHTVVFDDHRSGGTQ